MIINNVSINILESISQEWLYCMQITHIPKMMSTGLFLSAKMTRILVEEQMGGHKYSIKYTCESKSKLDQYKHEYASKLEEKHTKKFKGKFVDFKTLIKVKSDF